MNQSDVLKLLQALGPTCDRVATSLRERRIKGHTKSGCNCPIALYLKKCGVDNPLVTSSRIAWASNGQVEAVTTPSVIDLFIRHFDNLFYTDLILGC